MALIGVDIGTTGIRAVLFSERGKIITSSYQEHAYIYPNPGWAELDPEKVWEAVQKTIHEVCDRSKKPIKALAISCMGDSIVPIQDDGTLTYNGILSLDSRAIEEVAIIRNAIGEEGFYKITGLRLGTISSVSKILWLRRNKPGIFNDTQKFLTFADYILLRMGFPPTIDYSLAALTSAFDIRSKEYSSKILKEIGLTKDMYAAPFPSGHVLGEIPSAIRSQLGLPEGVKVVLGGVDGALGLLGAGLSSSTTKMAAYIGGTFGNIGYISKEPILDRQAFDSGLISVCNVIDDTYLVGGSLPTAGSAIRWFRDEFAYEEKIKAEKEKVDVYDVMFAPLEFDGGTILAIPYFGGTRQDAYAKATFMGLTLATSRQELLKGLVEGVTHELRVNVDRLEKLLGVSLEVIRAVGGSAKSDKWLQLKADITGRTIETVQTEEASALGAALLAGTATGVYNSIEEAIEVCVKRKSTFYPRPKIQEIYSHQHEMYKKLAKSLTPISRELSCFVKR